MQTLGLDSAVSQLDVLLELVCEQLQLTNTQHERATRSYEAVGDWLDGTGSALAEYQPRVFPQGSFVLGSTNKPRDREEFDVDLVCLLQSLNEYHNDPHAVYEAVLERLMESTIYRPILQPMKRCIRLDYAGEFHLDVVPACPSIRDGVPWGQFAIVIPDRDQRTWVPTNPRGYAAWFHTRSVLAQEGLVAASVEPLPPKVTLIDKTALHRIVQLFKRRRDVHFSGDQFAPRSILLTTIDGLYYRGEKSISNAIQQILEELTEWGLRINDSEPPAIANPTDANENLARHWREDPRHFQSFIDYVITFQGGMKRLRAARGLHAIASILNDLFDPTGSGIVNRAIAAYARRFQEGREGRGIGYTRGETGLAAVAATPRIRAVPKNVFYGVHD